MLIIRNNQHIKRRHYVNLKQSIFSQSLLSDTLGEFVKIKKSEKNNLIQRETKKTHILKKLANEKRDLGSFSKCRREVEGLRNLIKSRFWRKNMK